MNFYSSNLEEIARKEMMEMSQVCADSYQRRREEYKRSNSGFANIGLIFFTVSLVGITGILIASSLIVK